METINHFGIVKKKHTYLYNNFNDTMNEDFRKLGDDDNPNEIAARKAERKWKNYI